MKTGFGIGLLVGLLLAAPLVSMLYLLNTTLETPFIPFDLFDALVRILPGPIVSFGIDSMVRLLMFLGLSLSASSKTAEQIQAIGVFLCTCAVAAGVFFAVLSDRRSRAVIPLGVVLGIAAALPMATLSSHPTWTIISLTAWGIAVSGARYRIAGWSPVAAAPAIGSEHGLLQMAGESVDRRRFLVNLAGTTASITVVGAVVATALRASSSKAVVYPRRK